MPDWTHVQSGIFAFNAVFIIAFWKNNNRLLPYPVILAATKGDIEAMQAVHRLYAGYIVKLSMRPFYDENGNRYFVVDETMCHSLENSLAKAIIGKFKAV